METVANVSQGQVACDIIELVQNELQECDTALHRKFIILKFIIIIVIINSNILFNRLLIIVVSISI